MHNSWRSIPLRGVIAASAAMLASGCHAPADQAGLEGACRNHALVKALPVRTTINGLPFAGWECTPDTVSASYGIKGGKRVDIILSDTRSPTQSSGQMTKSNVQTLIATRKSLEAQPAMLALIGGPDYLPVIESSPTGDPLAINISPKGTQVAPGVEALLKDRYVLSVQARDRAGSFNDLSGPRAQALYDPFLQKMHLELLP